MEIIQDKQNPLLQRRELKIIVKADKNPTIEQVTKLLSEHFKTQEENIVVKLIKSKFGRKTFLTVANIYKNKDDKNKIEPKPKAKKGEKGEKPAEQITEQPQEQIKPTEQKE